MKIRVMTYNVQSFKNFKTKKIDYGEIEKIINKYKPDIIGLNEVFDKGYDRNISISQIEELNRNLKYNSLFAKAARIRGKNYGNALLSKFPIDNSEIIKIKLPLLRTGNKLYQKRCILKASVNGINILLTHLGLNDDEQRRGIKKIEENIDEKKCILMGDLNIEEDKDMIKKLDDKLYNTSKERKSKLLTYPSDKPSRKLDYIFVSNDIKVSRVFVPKVIVSDHRPYIVDIIL